jgi:integrase
VASATTPRKSSKSRRTDGISYAPSRGYWYSSVTGSYKPLRDLRGEKIRGLEGEAEARRAYFRLALQVGQQVPEQARPVVTVGEVVEAYPTTRQKMHYLRKFAAFVGENTPAHEVRQEQLSWWLDGNPFTGAKGMTTLGATTKNGIIGAVVTAFNYAVRHGAIPSNPFTNFKRPKAKSRSTLIDRDTVGTPSVVGPQEKLIFSQACGPFRDFLVVLWETGCRPKELATAEARHCQDVPGRGVVITLGAGEWKSGQKTGGLRRIFCKDRAAEIVRALVAKHPTGKLFCTSSGVALSDSNRVNLWRRLRVRCQIVAGAERLGVALREVRMSKPLQARAQEAGRQVLPDEVSLYSFRHSRATRMMAGIPLPTIAELLGTSVKMLEKHYNELKHVCALLWDAA